MTPARRCTYGRRTRCDTGRLYVAGISTIYRNRFNDAGLERRDRVWKTPAGTISTLFVTDGSVLDLAWLWRVINNIDAAQKFAVDTNPDAPKYLAAMSRLRERWRIA